MKALKATLGLGIIAAAGFLLTAAQINYTESNPDLPVVEEQMANLGIGDKAPEIEMRDPQGNIRKLSDLKGKIVLIDFWASWCRPCRMENPNVVKTYNEYKDVRFKNGDGFEVFSVSLDQNKVAWENGIKQDGLVWENHVSDLQYWRNAAARTYNVNSIPATFLIDGEGNIIKKNLRGPALKNTLEVLRK
jgi:peroxiredoxin